MEELIPETVPYIDFHDSHGNLSKIRVTFDKVAVHMFLSSDQTWYIICNKFQICLDLMVNMFSSHQIQDTALMTICLQAI